MGISHSKSKNTGIIFKLLSLKALDELRSGKKGKAIKILKTHFNENSELKKDLAIYDALISKRVYKNPDDFIKEIESSDTIWYDKLLKELRSINRSIQMCYGSLSEFYSPKISNYKHLATIEQFLKIGRLGNQIENIPQKMELKETIVEHLSHKEIESIKETMKFSPLEYTLFLKKFNKKYKVLSEREKSVIKEYIYTDNTFGINKIVVNFINELKEANKNIKDANLSAKLQLSISKLQEYVDNKLIIKSNKKEACRIGLITAKLVNELI